MPKKHSKDTAQESKSTSVSAMPLPLPSEGYARLPAVRAALGGVSRMTVYRWVKRGILPPPTRLGPRLNGWEVSALRAAMAKMAQQ